MTEIKEGYLSEPYRTPQTSWRTVRARERDNVVIVCDSRTGTIAQVYGEDREANAMLIAAAPDLLEALREILPAYRAAMLLLGQTAVDFDSSRDTVAARAALAKAEGKES